MKIILDTHTFIWWDKDPDKLPPKVLELIKDPESILIVSTASVWEMQIKIQLGKLSLGLPLREMVESQIIQNSIVVLPVLIDHVLALESLHAHHKDPFDRLLVAQAITEDAVLISGDRIFSEYPVKVVW